MLQIIHETPDVLILKDQRINAGLLSLMFTTFSLIALMLILSQGIDLILHPSSAGSQIARVLTYAVFVLILALCVGLGALTTLYLLVGTTCTFDKLAGTLTVERMNLLRRERDERPIYGFSHLDVEANANERLYGVFVVLRSGERIPLAVVSVFDQDLLDALMRRVRQFLRG